MKAVVTVVGKDTIGIFAKVSTYLAGCGANIIGVSQTILDDMFVMIMSLDVDRLTLPFGEFADGIRAYGEENALVIHAMHEDIFHSMHRI
ncbi:MAG TPA: ACT domain-containing protein [Clostridiales bacterium]|nr:ACT domain-containing protein [Clostridiales bacterium]